MLLNDDCVRNASVVAAERTDLVLISRALYWPKHNYVIIIIIIIIQRH